MQKLLKLDDPKINKTLNDEVYCEHTLTNEEWLLITNMFNTTSEIQKAEEKVKILCERNLLIDFVIGMVCIYRIPTCVKELSPKSDTSNNHNYLANYPFAELISENIRKSSLLYAEYKTQLNIIVNQYSDYFDDSHINLLQKAKRNCLDILHSAIQENHSFLRRKEKNIDALISMYRLHSDIAFRNGIDFQNKKHGLVSSKIHNSFLEKLEAEIKVLEKKKNR
ncbi:hypothetical protein A0H77_19470 [Vibrio alginolyticus]|uniref:hypothetical protein n=1 Tax=Vibrio alginolyticus TaxID=663 RepID=UPI00079BD1D4|nr:hypothetical protein [Vibrio alginolyticus]KXZ35078.1 hypothetical protein A0H77_19470 [Vibrio alginolyticus]